MNDLETNVRPQRKPPTYDAVQYVFLKALALIYLIAFASFGWQVTGLIGQRGILPLAVFLPRVREALGASGWLDFPTLFWFDSTDAALKLICFLGAVSAAFVFAGKFWRIALALCYVFYLSLVHAGQDFMSYQWDMLLLETGFLAIFLGWHPAVIWLYRWLLFRLMFLSGIAKLISGDRTWRNFSALRYHYETQPLPTPLAWFAHQFPPAFHRVSVGAMFATELVVPFLIFMPRRIRLTAGGAIVLLQVMILLTGNYTFFNWLTIALCLFTMDDESLRPWIPRRILNRIRPAAPAPIRAVTRPVAAVAAALVVLLTSILFLSEVAGLTWKPATTLVRALGPFGIANNYGLFAVMTVTRDEIIVEGSNDGQHWLAYEFNDKPGDVYRAPPIVAPFQPRLDWQMWFAALSSYRQNPWFVNFVFRLLQGSPQVLRLLRKNPFPSAPPRYIRAELYRYWFTDWSTKGKTGAWWNRTPRGLYLPAISLEDIRAEGM
jgi:hypothetical protein